jgi:hypothetical protein
MPFQICRSTTHESDTAEEALLRVKKATDSHKEDPTT